MKKAKYIIINHLELETPIIFSPLLNHKDVANGQTVLSAGFCNLNESGQWKTWGKSISLNISSQPDDNLILNNCLMLDV